MSLPAGNGILLTIAPSAAVAADLPTLLRVALDSEQVGAGRLHLPADLPGAELAVSELRAATGLVLSSDPGGTVAQLCDPPGPSFADIVIEPADPADLLTTVAALTVGGRAHGRAISVSGRSTAALPVALAAIAAGLHLRVGTADADPLDAAPAAAPAPSPPAGIGDPPGHPSARPDVALIARAAGLARIAGRAPIRGAAAAALLGVGAVPDGTDVPPGRSAAAAAVSMEGTVR